MTTSIPESHIDLLNGPILATFTTLSPDGKPENTVVWCSYDGEYVLVNTVEGRRKAKNIHNNPNVALLAIDPQNAYRWIDVRGSVADIVPDEGYANINAHAQIYVGAERYYGGFAPAEREGTEARVVLRIRPERVVTVP